MIRTLAIGVKRINTKSYHPPFNRILHQLPYAEPSAKELAGLSGAAKPTFLFGPKATRKAVEAALKQHVEFAKNGDSVFVSFSGHGVRLVDTKGDERDGLSECWCLWDTMMHDSEVIDHLEAFPKGASVVIVSDCCHAGGVVDRIGHSTAKVKANVVAMAGCSEFEDGYEQKAPRGKEPLSAFVAALSKELRGEKAPQTYRDLQARLTRDLSKPPLKQDPSITPIGGLEKLRAARPFWRKDAQPAR
jgi:hypothetical protein